MRSTSRTKHSPRKTKFNNSGGDWLRARAGAGLPKPLEASECPREGRRRKYRCNDEGRRLAFLSVPRPPGFRPTPPLPSDAESAQAETGRSRPSLFCEIGSLAQCRPNSAHGSLVQTPARQRPASFSCTGQFLASARGRNHFVGRLICEPWEYGVFTPPDLGFSPTFLHPGCSVKL